MAFGVVVFIRKITKTITLSHLMFNILPHKSFYFKYSPLLSFLEKLPQCMRMYLTESACYSS